MNRTYEVTYCLSYLGICAALILWLGRVLRRAGRVLFDEAFPGAVTLIRALTQLLDIGFYLVSFGYVTAWVANYEALHDPGEVVKMESGTVGGLLPLLGCAHLFNILLLALFRRRGSVASVVAS